MKTRIFAGILLMGLFVISIMLLSIVGIYIYISYKALIGISSIMEAVGFIGLQIIGVIAFTLASYFFSGLLLALMADCATELKIKKVTAVFTWLFEKFSVKGVKV